MLEPDSNRITHVALRDEVASHEVNSPLIVNHDRFLGHVHSDIFNFTAHSSCLPGGKQFVPTSTFPQGKSAIVQDTHLAFS
jgi:hypothetical protein